MSEHTYAFTADYSKEIIPVRDEKKGLRRPATRDEIFSRGRHSTPEEIDKLEEIFKPIDFDNDGEREAALRHFLSVVANHPDTTEVAYFARRDYLNPGKIRFELEEIYGKQLQGVKGVIEVHSGDDLEMGFGQEADTIDLALLTISVVRENQ